MNKYTASLFACAFLLGGQSVALAQSGFTFLDIKDWVGSGSNQSALVISWNDSKSPDTLVWGYRWSGSAPTIYSVLQAIEVADPRFSFTAHPLYQGISMYSGFYDLTGQGGSPTVGTPGDLGGTENGHAPVAGDHYAEGWYTGFWGELLGVGNPFGGGSWDSMSGLGIGTDTVTNNGWFAMSYTSDVVNYSIPNPGTPNAVIPAPEPASIGLLALGGLGLWARRRRGTS